MSRTLRIAIVLLVMILLSLIYVYQQFDYGNWIAGLVGLQIDQSTFTLFIINKMPGA